MPSKNSIIRTIAFIKKILQSSKLNKCKFFFGSDNDDRGCLVLRSFNFVAYIPVNDRILYSTNRVTNIEIKSRCEIVFGQLGPSYCGNHAFEGSRRTLKSVTFQENSKLNTISDCAFFECSELNAIDFSNCKYLKTINTYAFFNCHSIVNISLPSSVQVLSKYCFIYCSKLENVFIQSDSELRTMNTGCFKGTVLKSLFIPKYVSVIYANIE